MPSTKSSSSALDCEPNASWWRFEFAIASIVLAIVPIVMACDLGPSSNATAAEGRISSEDGEHTTIRGRVIDEDGSPIADAAVRLFELRVEPHLLRWDALPHVEAHTNAKGAFEFDSIPVGLLSIVVAKVPERATTAFSTVVSRTSQEVVLKALPATELIVTLSDCSWPTIAVDAGALLWIEPLGNDCAATFAALAPGTVIIHPADSNGRIVGSGHVLTLGRAGRLLGEIEVRQNGVFGSVALTEKPLVDAEIELIAKSSTGTSGSIITKTDAMGRFEFRDLHPGEWEIFVEAQGKSLSRRVDVGVTTRKELRLAFTVD